MARRRGGLNKAKGEEKESSPTSPIAKPIKVQETEDIVVEDKKAEPAPPKIRLRLASTGTFLAHMRQEQFANGDIKEIGHIKINQWLFHKAEIKTVYVTPEISHAIKQGVFEVLNPNPHEEVDES